jgi:hypothetical protein
MNLRDIFVSISCCAAALGLSSGKPARAGDLQSSNETVPRTDVQCIGGIPPAAEASCERIGGHLRVEFGPRSPNPSGLGRPGASPVAVRSDGGAQSSDHIYLPVDGSGFDPFRR